MASRLPNKSIYVRGEEAERVWDRAKELGGVSMSALIVQLLKEYVEKQERRK
jgi:hypothetical protein